MGAEPLADVIAIAVDENRQAGRKATRVVIHNGEPQAICVEDCDHTECWAVPNRPHWPGCYTQSPFRTRMRDGDI